ncbi:MAG TPA: FG-GAP-like repeat-containing protein, partial [Arthrobacter sp.]|nr:FG-GAP-like repeat-containing protein [Arthrobacter sp.]
DLVGRRSDGTLWFYAGSGSVSAGYDRKVQIGVGGWDQFSQIVGSGDVTGDGIPDLLGVRDDGLMYLYAGTGKGDQQRRVRAGNNWDRFDYLLGPGDFNADGKADLYARKADGTLWFLAGNGRGDFAAAEKVGVGGWDQFSRIMGIGDNNRDNNPDILAVGKDDSLSFYAGTGMPNPDGHKPGRRIGSNIWNVYDEILTPGDFNGDNIADIIARKPDGSLWFMAGNGQPGHAAPRQIGRGWDMHNKIIGAGDYDDNGTNDLIARDKDGALWFYAGTGTVTNRDNGLERRVKIGVGGWNQFIEILGIGDFDGNGHNDLLGIRADGTLRFYSGNGTGTSTGKRTSMGRGWDMYDKYIAPGDYDGDNKSDIIAVAPDGSLWLYPGTGNVTKTSNGYQTPRTNIGTGGWKTFNHILGVKDFNTDGKNDLIGIDRRGRVLFYEGTQMTDKGYQPNKPAGTLN